MTTTAAVILYLLGLDNSDRSSKPESVECSLEVEGRKATIGAVLSMSSLSVSLLLLSAVAVPTVAVSAADIDRAALHDAVVDVVVVFAVASSDAIFSSIWWTGKWVC